MITFPFWYFLHKSVANLPQEKKEPFLSFFLSLIDLLGNHLMFPSNFDSILQDHQDDFKQLRYDISEILKDACTVVGANACISLLYQKMIGVQCLF